MQEAGRKAVLVAGDIGSSEHCRAIIDKAVAELGGVDILVNNAAHQATFKSIEDVSDEEWELRLARSECASVTVAQLGEGACG